MTTDLQAYLSAVELELRRAMPDVGADVAPFYQMMAYHLGWVDEHSQPVAAYSGKRVRPLLCLLACEAAGGDWHEALPAAAALELVHNFSLIHDDIEDGSHTRRGRTTLWKIWGAPQGINAGDGMLMLARLALSRLRLGRVDAATALTAMTIFDETCLALCEGQYLDMACEGHLDVSEALYLRMIAGKTAALLAASAQLGALIGGGTDRAARYRQFGWHLGLAFQMVDDILGIWGDPGTTGKPAADDLRCHKMTLPVIFALRAGDRGSPLARMYRQEQPSEHDISAALAILDATGAREYTEAQAQQHEASALSALDDARPREPAAAHLRRLASSLTFRDK